MSRIVGSDICLRVKGGGDRDRDEGENMRWEEGKHSVQTSAVGMFNAKARVLSTTSRLHSPISRLLTPISRLLTPHNPFLSPHSHSLPFLILYFPPLLYLLLLLFSFSLPLTTPFFFLFISLLLTHIFPSPPLLRSPSVPSSYPSH